MPRSEKPEPRDPRAPSGYVRALRQIVREAIGAKYAGDELPDLEQLEQAKRDGIAAARAVKAGMPLQKKIAEARRNAAALGTRKYTQV